MMPFWRSKSRWNCNWPIFLSAVGAKIVTRLRPRLDKLGCSYTSSKRTLAV
ncbi:hypothetical protein BISU_1617 [Bifidobacterium subtile]|uniref:Uncharacterized protein n=1 Tax=Bifidobacterium subtile TaxID=77635 RepID=A0A087EBD8_9BIFI|nr:hypothetical protein BISU_1617 [Bifidobacterium subtile]